MTDVAVTVLFHQVTVFVIFVVVVVFDDDDDDGDERREQFLPDALGYPFHHLLKCLPREFFQPTLSKSTCSQDSRTETSERLYQSQIIFFDHGLKQWWRSVVKVHGMVACDISCKSCVVVGFVDKIAVVATQQVVFGYCRRRSSSY